MRWDIAELTHLWSVFSKWCEAHIKTVTYNNSLENIFSPEVVSTLFFTAHFSDFSWLENDGGEWQTVN